MYLHIVRYSKQQYSICGCLNVWIATNWQCLWVRLSHTASDQIWPLPYAETNPCSFWRCCFQEQTDYIISYASQFVGGGQWPMIIVLLVASVG